MSMVDRRAPRATGNHDRVAGGAAAPHRTAARRRVRVPELALGVVLVFGFGLAAVVWQSSSSRRVPVTVLATELRRGEVVGLADLRAEAVGSGEGVPLVAWSDHDQFVGKVALADLPAGLPLRPELVGEVPDLGAGDGLVALRLVPGSFPAGSLRVGDVVDVVFAPPTGVEPDPALPPSIVASAASVWDVAELADAEGSALVTLRLPIGSAHQVGAAAGSVRLVRVGG